MRRLYCFYEYPYEARMGIDFACFLLPTVPDTGTSFKFASARLSSTGIVRPAKLFAFFGRDLGRV